MHIWNSFRDGLLSVSCVARSVNSGNQQIDEDEQEFHIGVIVAGIFVLSSNSYTEDEGMLDLRSQVFVSKLDRCITKPKNQPPNVKEAIFDSPTRRRHRCRLLI